MLNAEWAKEIRRTHPGYFEELIDHYGTKLAVWVYVETGGRAEGFPPYIDHCLIRKTDGTKPDLEDWEIDEILDHAFKARTSCTMLS